MSQVIIDANQAEVEKARQTEEYKKAMSGKGGSGGYSGIVRDFTGTPTQPVIKTTKDTKSANDKYLSELQENKDDYIKHYGAENYSIALDYFSLRKEYEPYAGLKAYNSISDFEKLMIDPDKYIQENGQDGYYQKIMAASQKAIDGLNSLAATYENDPNKLLFSKLKELYPNVMEPYHYDLETENSEDINREALDLTPAAVD